MGYPKIGKYLSIGLGLVLVIIITYGIFQDAFFTKNQAKKILAEQDIVLKDDFKVLNNKTRSPLGDYYHRFRLEISEEDKNRLINEIKLVPYFKSINEEKKDLLSDFLDEKASKIKQNYEDEDIFVKEYLRPNHEGGKSTYLKIEVGKNDDTLVYEEIRN